jgi:IS5 family transposase
MKSFKKHRDFGLFDGDIRIEKLIKLGCPLDRLSNCIDFESFRPSLTNVFLIFEKGKGGRPPYDYVVMFKILLLQKYFNLSDDQVEFQINDRISFMRFLGFSFADDIPDSKTVWHFREKLIDAGIMRALFDLFLTQLEKLGLVINEGKIVDASFIEIPKQRNSKEENKEIKAGMIPANFTKNPNKLAQKDTDARWTQKNKINYYGYKNHIKVDSESKIITNYVVTDASVHDSQEILGLLTEKDKDQPLYADSAYTGEVLQKNLLLKEVCLEIHEKGVRNHPLNETQLANNKVKSKTRARVEHVFGFMENSMNGMGMRYIGIKRIEACVGLQNLVYNMFRKIQLQHA